MKHLVLVVGVGRSGTSLLSGILGQLGFAIPQPEVQADDTNPRGFGEPRWVVDFHSRVLKEQARHAQRLPARRLGADGASPATDGAATSCASGCAVSSRKADAIVVKDPRTVWFLALWRNCADRARRPHLVRDDAAPPGRDRRQRAQVVRPRADRGEPHRGLAQRDARDRARDPWRAARVRPLLRPDGRLGAGDPPPRHRDRRSAPARRSTVCREVDAFVDPTLHRNRTTWDDLDVPATVRDLAEETWGAACRRATRRRSTPTARRTAKLYGEAEAIAQCSIMSARPIRRAAAPAAPKPPPTLRVRVARRIPRAVPEAPAPARR